MQNENTLLELGFIKIEDRYELKGLHQTFIGRVDRFGGRDSVRLLMYSKEIDKRPFSTNFGKPFVSSIKDCCSTGSVQRAIIKFDLPDEKLQDTFYGVKVIEERVIYQILTIKP